MNIESEDTENTITFEDIEARQRQDGLGVSQRQTLNLRPWQEPTDDFFWDRDETEEILAAGPSPNDIGQHACATLAKQLLDAGLSLFEPDPVRALNDDDYREEIRKRVRKLKAANRNGLTDQAIETIILLTPYPLMRPMFEDPHAEKETTEFRRLLAEQCPGPVTINGCEQVIDVLWNKMQEKRRIESEEHYARNHCQPKS